MRAAVALALGGVVATALSSCGSSTKPTAGDPAADVCRTGAVQPGPSPLRRLSRVEYGNTIYQLFGNPNDQVLGFETLVADGEALGFSNQASVVSTSPLLASQYLSNAAELSETHIARFVSRVPACEGADPSPRCDAEIRRWVERFGKRVYRRPLRGDEIDFYLDLYRWEVDRRNDFEEGMKLVVQTMLQSPHFLYRPEFGDPSKEDGGAVPLTGWEMASRLSYMFWNTMPDAGLLEAAERDELRTPEQIAFQARRLLQAGRARVAIRNFHNEWLDLEEILEVRNNGKNLTLFPDYSDSMPPELHAETLEFLDYVIFEGDAKLSTLFNAPFTRMNRHTAAFYGIDDGPTGDEFVTVQLDPERYSGFLTQAGLLMAHAFSDLGSPIHRGLFVRTNLLCQPPPPPPPDVPPPPQIDRTMTTREQFALHSGNNVCGACHMLMDPIGLAFEHFDAMGRYRPDENGLPIDATGQILQRGAESGEWITEASFDGVQELGTVLAQSNRVRSCVARQWFRYSMGRSEMAEADQCSLRSIDEAFARSGYDIKELLVAITQTPAFRYRGVSRPGASLPGASQ